MERKLVIQRSLIGVASGISILYPCRCIGMRHLSRLSAPGKIVTEADHPGIEEYQERILGM
jgi:hypothetical protein